jgi:hypothetical protein
VREKRVSINPVANDYLMRLQSAVAVSLLEGVYVQRRRVLGPQEAANTVKSRSTDIQYTAVRIVLFEYFSLFLCNYCNYRLEGTDVTDLHQIYQHICSRFFTGNVLKIIAFCFYSESTGPCMPLIGFQVMYVICRSN